MLTILAWLIFIPALVWNVVMFTVIVMDMFDSKFRFIWKYPENIIKIILSLIVLFVTGIYLFGIW